MSSGVYLITHLPSGMQYVGASVRAEQRIRAHLNPRHKESWKYKLPEGLVTPAAQLTGEVIEYVDSDDRDQAERDWWFLLRPELNEAKIPTMIGCGGGRLKKDSPCSSMIDFLEESKEAGIESSMGWASHSRKDHLWDVVVNVMEKGAYRRRGHLLAELTEAEA